MSVLAWYRQFSMKKYIYLALVDDDFILKEEIKSYFREKNIEILKYYDKFNMLKLEAQYSLILDHIKYIHHLELEKEFTIP